jgi:DNA-binding NarL/FixJ family response regulator
MAHVLIVEDEQALASAYTTILQTNGFDVRAAADGEQALEAVKAAVPDVILLDMLMPKMNGIEFLRNMQELLADDSVKAPAVVVFSNMDTQSDIDEAYQLGAKRYILKSWASPQDLVRVVNEALEA